MARTPLFSSLRRLYRSALLGASAEPPVKGDAATRLASRREILRASASLAAAALPAAALTGCGDDETDPTPEKETVVIVGGGIAGIHCAYRLKEADVVATIYEAQDRVGGRMFTARGAFSEAPDQICELGGELVDSGHATLFALSEELELTLDDRVEAGKRDVYFIEGVDVPESVLVDQFSEVAPIIAAQVEAVEIEGSVAYAMFDEQNINQWCDEYVPVAMYPELNKVLKVAYRNEYGLENDEQSSLNLIYLIGSDDPDPFRLFGESDERYHTHLGNDSFPTKLAAALDAEQIKLEHTLLSVKDAEGGFELRFDTPDGEVTVTATRVVFALPFTKLREVDLTGLSLSDEKRNIIDTLGYGTNAKVMIGFSSRVWNATHDTSGGMVTDLPVQQSWDTTIGQDGAHGILTNFLGGQTGLDAGAGEATDWAESVVPDLETIWPGMAAAYTGQAVRMHWPTVPTMKGSYACYKPGQWAFFGLEGAREGNLHFCGEHTSLDFQGYMEGGAESGALVAAEILVDFDMNQPQGMINALGVKLLIPQAGYRAKVHGNMNAFQRRRIARKTLADLAAQIRDARSTRDAAH